MNHSDSLKLEFFGYSLQVEFTGLLNNKDNCNNDVNDCISLYKRG